jgi:hypothetical protein
MGNLYFLLLALDLHLVKEISSLLGLILGRFDPGSSCQLQLNLLGEKSLVLLYDRGLVVDMIVIGGDDSSFLEVLEGSAVSALLHVEELFTIPTVEVDGLGEGVDDPVLAVSAGAVEAEVYSQVNGGPLRVFLLAIETDLNVQRHTLLSWTFLI